MSRLSKIGAACLAAFGWTSGASGVTASYLVVAGGAGGGFDIGGGGGAGGFKTGSVSLNPSVSYTIIVGAGGVGSTSGSTTGFSGADSSLSGSGITTVTSTGGGGGGSRSAARNGANGGSGGGGSADVSTGGTGTSGQGNNGGSQSSGDQAAGGGGASAAGAGGGGVGTGTGNGGDGSASSITGSSVTYAGGGGGGSSPAQAPAGTGGAGGGGAGSSSSSGATAGTANFGGGGGGGSNQLAPGSYGAQGGSGVVIISYVGAQQFSGGIVTYSGGNTIHTFTTSGTLGPATPITASYLVVGGGGSGGNGNASIRVYGGGGAGGLLSGSVSIDANSTYLVTVGAGAASQTTANSYGFQGSSSSFSMVATTAVGGGAGAPSAQGGDGGSGGGGGMDGSVYAPGNGTSGQGNNGGTGTTTGGGGGGGAGAVGSNASIGAGGAGGIGVASSISGTSTYYAGGGGGGGASSNGAGGTGGGGSGSTAGTANTGGGGGGTATNITSGAGGSGVVIISYPGSTQLLAGGTVTIVGGNVIHTFKSTGYLAPIKYATNSLRFRSSASAYLTRTMTTPTSSQKWTFSDWIKRGSLSSAQFILQAGDATNQEAQWYFQADNTIRFYQYTGSYQYDYTTAQVFRDPAAWYHIVVSYDSTQATAANRFKVYINGLEITLTRTVDVTLNATNSKVNSAVSHDIGGSNIEARWFDGYLTEVNFIDGQALAPTSFGTFNSYGVWQPINYGGSYGTNGFYLPFTNKTSTTTLGYDFSPNGNNWTTNNISLTAGSTYDSMTDVPTLTSATVANYCVANPLLSNSSITFSNANLTLAVGATGGVYRTAGCTFAQSTGKWYWEFTFDNIANNPLGGVGDITLPKSTWESDTTTSSSFWYINAINGNKSNGSGTSTAYGSAFTTSNICMVALDMNNNKIWWGKDGVWFASGDPAAGTNAAYTNLASKLLTPAFFGGAGSGGGNNYTLNFGQRPFSYTPPTGFVALNSYNM